MIRKSIFVVLAVFGLGSFVQMAGAMNHMSSMMASDGDEGGLNGSFRLRYQAPLADSADGVGDFSYRARVGWNGDINEMISWGVGFSTNVVEEFNTLNPKLGINLEQAYISYQPMEGFSLKVGKWGWNSNFNKVGVLYDDESYYPEGVMLKYHHMMDNMHGYAKLALYELNSGLSAPLASGTVLKAKIGGMFDVADDFMAGVHASAIYDGLFKDSDVTPKTLASVMVNVSTSSMPVPAGLFAAYLANVEELGDSHSFSGGVYVGNAGSAANDEANDFGVALNYYDVKSSAYLTNLAHTDYIFTRGADMKGVALRAQYNLWDGTNLVAHVSHDLNGGDNANNVVGELTFNF